MNVVILPATIRNRGFKYQPFSPLSWDGYVCGWCGSKESYGNKVAKTFYYPIASFERRTLKFKEILRGRRISKAKEEGGRSSPWGCLHASVFLPGGFQAIGITRGSRMDTSNSVARDVIEREREMISSNKKRIGKFFRKWWMEMENERRVIRINVTLCKWRCNMGEICFARKYIEGREVSMVARPVNNNCWAADVFHRARQPFPFSPLHSSANFSRKKIWKKGGGGGGGGGKISESRSTRWHFLCIRRHVSRMDETVKNCDNLPCFLKWIPRIYILN